MKYPIWEESGVVDREKYTKVEKGHCRAHSSEK
jgi:hypothetical protein